MRQVWTIIGVDNVACSYDWYRTLLGLVDSQPAHDYFGQLVDDDGTVLLCLHSWGYHRHPTLLQPDPSPGNGLLLFFRVDDFDATLRRAQELVTDLEEEPSKNANTGTLEFSLRDPDGYFVMVSSIR